MHQGCMATSATSLALSVTLVLILTGAVCAAPVRAAEDAAPPKAQRAKNADAKAASTKSAQAGKAAPKTPGAAKAASARKPAGDTIEDVHNKLETLARAKLRHMNESLRPCQTRKDVVRNGTEFVARYLAVDPDSLSTDVHDAQGPGAKYVGLIVYHEQEFENRADTREAALTGSFTLVRARRVTEIIRYDKGKWID